MGWPDDFAVVPPEDTEHVEAMALSFNSNPSILSCACIPGLCCYLLDPRFFHCLLLLFFMLKNLYTGLFIFNKYIFVYL